MARLYASNADGHAHASPGVSPADGVDNSRDTSADDSFMTTKSRSRRPAMQSAWSGGLLKLPLHDLVSELKKVHEFLSPMDQDHVDRPELLPLATQLASPGLIKHKDRAVRVLVACALANILRLFAPEAPYAADQLTSMFALFAQQLRGVSEPDGVYYAYHYFLLESLSTVKSVVLIFDLPEGLALQQQFITLAFDLIHPSLQKGVRLYLVELAQTLLEEGDTIPVDIVNDLLIGSLANTNANTNASAMAMAQDLVRLCGDRLQTHLGQHFNDALSRLARRDEPETVLVRLARDVHDYAVTIVQLSPVAGAHILKLLEEELRAEDADLRVHSISALARLFTGMSAAQLNPASTASSNPSSNSNHTAAAKRTSHFAPAFEAWTLRRQDKSAKCRIAWTNGAVSVVAEALRLANNQPLSERLLPYILERFVDPDEKVRLACLNASTDSLLPLAQTVPKAVVEAVAERCMDRKDDVLVAARQLAASWLLVCLRQCTTLPGFSRATGELSRKLLTLVYTDMRQHALSAIVFLDTAVFGAMAREGLSTERRLWFIAAASGNASEAATATAKEVDDGSQCRCRAAIQTVLRHKAQVRKAWLGLLKTARMSRPLPGVLQAKWLQLVQFLAEAFPVGLAKGTAFDVQRALLELEHIDSGLLDALVLAAEKPTLIADQTRLAERITGARLNGILTELLTAPSANMIAYASPASVPASLATELSALSRTTGNNLASVAAAHLRDVLAEFPQMFADRADELIAAVLASAGDTASLAALASYSAFLRQQNTAPPANAELKALLESIIEGETGELVPKRVAYAAVAAVNMGLLQLTPLIQGLHLHLASKESIVGRSALVALTALVRSVPEAAAAVVPLFEGLLELISETYCTPAQLTHDCTPTNVSAHPRRRRAPAHNASGGTQDTASASDPQTQAQTQALLAHWPSLTQLPVPRQQNVLAVRLLTSIVAALIRQHTRVASRDFVAMVAEGVVDLDVVSSIRSLVVGFLLSCLETLDGASVSIATAPATLRLRYSLLKGLLTCLPDASVADVSAHLLRPLVTASQDSHHGLRLKLLGLLGKLVRIRRISDAFTPLLFFAGAQEPLPLLQSLCSTLITEALAASQTANAGDLISVLLVYCSQHPDCLNVESDSATQDLVSGCIQYYAELVLRAPGCGAAYEAAGRLKLYHLPQDHPASVRLYCTAELAQRVIKQHAALHHWPLSIPDVQDLSATTTLSMLVPEVLLELPEAIQCVNVHREYLSRSVDENSSVSVAASGAKRAETEVPGSSRLIKKNRRVLKSRQ